MWIEDSLPPGAKAQGNEGDKSWKFVKKSEEHPVLSGETSSVRTATGLSQHFFEGANPPLTINEGDVLFAHVYLNPENPPDPRRQLGPRRVLWAACLKLLTGTIC